MGLGATTEKAKYVVFIVARILRSGLVRISAEVEGKEGGGGLLFSGSLSWKKETNKWGFGSSYLAGKKGEGSWGLWSLVVCVWPGLKKWRVVWGLARRFTGVSGCSPGILGGFWVSAGGFGLGFRRFLVVVDGVLWLEIKMELGCGCFRSTGSNKNEGKEAWVLYCRSFAGFRGDGSWKINE
ncbi:hypothetical protein KY285_023488 [Solanum tuberosum]|nr:hypothetical protein KY289_023822 [Solanum tuberosum]KAH0675687.1 hypothetical protein KY285_023488 [Solanum tuberosum]